MPVRDTCATAVGTSPKRTGSAPGSTSSTSTAGNVAGGRPSARWTLALPAGRSPDPTAGPAWVAGSRRKTLSSWPGQSHVGNAPCAAIEALTGVGSDPRGLTTSRAATMISRRDRCRCNVTAMVTGPASPSGSRTSACVSPCNGPSWPDQPVMGARHRQMRMWTTRAFRVARPSAARSRRPSQLIVSMWTTGARTGRRPVGAAVSGQRVR